MQLQDGQHQDIREKTNKWHQMNNKKEWKQLDKDLENILEIILQGSVERKIILMSAIIYIMGCK